MKKIIALVLALVMVLTVSAVLAEGASKTGDDTTRIVVPKKAAFVFGISDDPALIEWANAELAKMKEAESIQAYFGQADEIAAILGEPEYTVNEFWPVFAVNYEESMGAVQVILNFATPYEKDQDVAVMIGAKAGEDGMSWKTFTGKGQEDGSVAVTLDPATVMDVQDNNGLLAVVNK